MPQQPIISLKDVAVRYKRSGSIFRKTQYYQALKSINVDIYPGETLGIMGRNGSGKSTVLKLISGIIKPDKGTLINHNVSVALLSLQAGFDQNLSGRDNAILSGMLQGFSRREVENKLDEIESFSELGGFFNEPVQTYSSGMRTRLGFSISTIVSPDVLLIDEVLSVGDRHFREKAEKAMLSKMQSNQTVVLVSHAHEQICRLCDRAIAIENGISVAEGRPSEVVKAYENLLNSEIKSSAQ